MSALAVVFASLVLALCACESKGFFEKKVSICPCHVFLSSIDRLAPAVLSRSLASLSTFQEEESEAQRLPTAYLPHTAYYLPHTTCSLLPTSYLLPTGSCLLPTAGHLLPPAYYLLPTECHLPPEAHCPLPNTYSLPTNYSLPTTYCLLPTTYYLLAPAYYLLLPAAYLPPTGCLLSTVYSSRSAPVRNAFRTKKKHVKRKM